LAQQNQIPKIDLTTFFLSISSAAFMGIESDPDLARQNIDLLELMHEKTRGNRTPEEDKLIEQLLFETRMRYCEAQAANPKKSGKPC
jgi:hypothetical protein